MCTCVGISLDILAGLGVHIMCARIISTYRTLEGGNIGGFGE